MGTDAQHLDERQLIERERPGLMQVGDGHAEELLHPPVDMHAQHLHALAAVRLPAPASTTATTMQIGIDGTPVADRHVRRADGGSQRQHFNTQLMAEDARILEEWLIAAKSVQISAADAHPPDPHQGHPRLRRLRRGCIGQA